MSGPENVRLENSIDRGKEKQSSQKNTNSVEQAKKKGQTMIENANKEIVILSDTVDKETIKVINDNNFTTEVLESPMPVLVAFSTPKNNTIKATLNKLGQKYSSFKFGSFNINKNNKMTSEFNIDRDPTFILFHHGKVIEKIIGNGSEKIERALNSMLK